MARKPRIHFPGALYHVMMRGNNGQKIFFDAADRDYFSSLVSDGIKRYHHKIYAYCWMSNHIHLAIEVGKIPLSKIIQNISFRYTRYINKKQNKIGHLFQGRYKAILVEKDNYLLELIRYIHLNPIRAKLVKNLVDYKWCGHKDYLGFDQNSWLDLNSILAFFSKNKTVAIKKYQKFIKEGVGQEDINFEIGQQDPRIIGDDKFIEEQVIAIQEHDFYLELNNIVKVTCNLLNVSKKQLKQKTREREITFARNFIGYMNKHYGSSTMRSVAEQFSLDPTTLSRSVTRLEGKISDLEFSQLIASVKKMCKK